MKSMPKGRLDHHFVKRAHQLLVGLILLVAFAAHAQTKTIHFYYTDAQGTVIAKTDVKGNIIARYDYRPYGAPVSGQAPSGPGYTGHVNDPKAGLIYMQQRYDDPLVGRFLSVDPAVPMPGNVYNINRYGYANNNPYRYTDPDGRCPDGDMPGGCGALAQYAGAHPGAINSETALSLVPIVGDAVNIAEAYNNPTAGNLAVAAT
jgi:RHS repeat-associated protein